MNSWGVYYPSFAVAPSLVDIPKSLLFHTGSPELRVRSRVLYHGSHVGKPDHLRSMIVIVGRALRILSICSSSSFNGTADMLSTDRPSHIGGLNVEMWRVLELKYAQCGGWMQGESMSQAPDPMVGEGGGLGRLIEIFSQPKKTIYLRPLWEG